METAVATAPEPVVESRREQIASMFDEVEANPDVVISDRVRDESGRFAPKAAPVEKPVEKVVDKVEKVETAPVVAPVEEMKQEPTPQITTWRKEYLPIQAKLEKGENLTPDEAKKLAAYNVEREKQYATGISTYKGEAQQAKQFTEALTEFMPLLQRENINPATWIQNMGRAHALLVFGKPEQKLQMFAKLAQDYGVPLGAVSQAQQGQLDPVMLQLMQELHNVKQGVSSMTTWRQQQEEQVAAQAVSKFTDTTKYPYFEQVRETMVELLQSNLARDPDEAYTKAVRLNDEVWTTEQQRLAAASAPQINRQAAVTKAKASHTQVRSAAPSGAALNVAAKDRRSALATAFEGLDSGRV